MADMLAAYNEKELNTALDLARRTVYRDYVNEIGTYPLVEPGKHLLLEKPEECLRVFQLSQFTLKKGEDVFQKLSTVYHAAMSLGSSLFIMLDVAGLDAPVNIYLGIHQPLREDETERQHREKMSVSFDALRDGLNSNFPGSQMQTISPSQTLPSELDKIFSPVTRCISSVSCVASVRDKSRTENKNFVQGLEKLVDAMRGKPYTAILIADPVSPPEQASIRSGYEGLYSALSTFRKSVWSYSENESLAVMESLSRSMTESVTDSVTQTQSHTIGKTTGTSNTFGIGAQMGMNESQQDSASVSIAHSKSKTTPTEKARAGQAISGAAHAVKSIPIIGPFLSAIAGGVGGAMSGASTTTGVTTAIARGIAQSIGVSGGLNLNYAYARSKSSTESDTSSNGASRGTTKGYSDTSTEGKTDTKGMGRTLQIETANKSIEEMLSRIEAQLRRVKEGEDYGAYNFGAYFLSSKKEYALLAANTYRALMMGEGSAVENSAVNIWDDTNRVEAMKEYLRHFTQPIFALPVSVTESGVEYSVCSPGTIVSGLELPLHLGLPTKSVMGLAVVDHAEFGRNPPATTENNVRLGEIFHMGRTEENRVVAFDRQNLTAHTFITGSTGSGKSNAVYMLLKRLCLGAKTPVKFLVIEPAKGEYKKTLGGYQGVSVYGTNPSLTSLLRMNPFSFPEEIHVLEHIDRLVEVFNACWPMYAAMPAVLKDAIESAYADCGWSLSRSARLPDGRFPTFFDVLKKLPDIIMSSAYSSDTKGDYTGALETRVKSLTSGLNGQILCSDEEISNLTLFDENVIIDLSRVGSAETKALYMGILMIKLQEYRMAKAENSDEELRHITVLEEAHNLLRRTAMEQTQESSNLRGQSVQMFANAIAEMRTYGEGFVIADQAPGLLDMAVIRNTNTKIIFRLPDSSDRELAGKAANLDSNQILELAKLERGVAAVYQNEWQEPVLCKIDWFDTAWKKPYHCSASDITSEARMDAFFHILLHETSDGYELTEDDADKLRMWINRQEINWDGKTILQNVIDAPHTIEDEQRRRVLFALLHGPALVSNIRSGEPPEMVRGLINQRISDTLHVKDTLADKIRKLIFMCAADQAREINDQALYQEVVYYGGV